MHLCQVDFQNTEGKLVDNAFMVVITLRQHRETRQALKTHQHGTMMYFIHAEERGNSQRTLQRTCQLSRRETS